MVDVSSWHTFLPRGSLPQFLHDYLVILDKHTSPKLTRLVHTLYHSTFEDWEDLLSVLPSIVTGETIAILNPDRTIAVAAITFVACRDGVVILYLAAQYEYQGLGFGNFLFSLVASLLRFRYKVKSVPCYLKANPVENANAVAFYSARGFKEMPKLSFPKALVNELKEVDPDEHFTNYFEGSPDLRWYSKQLKAADSMFNTKKASSTVNHRFFTDPNWFGSPTVYAHLPGDLSLQELEHCAPNFRFDASLKLKNSVFYPTREAVGEQSFGGTTVHMSWTTRCYSKRREGITYEFLHIVISWLQRYSNAKIWTNSMTIIPPDVMSEVATMQTLFANYVQAEEMSQEVIDHPNVPRLTPQEVELQNFNHVFHPEIDLNRFLAASCVVIHFIEANKDLFKKPYIAMVSQFFKDSCWSSFVAFNSGNISRREEQDGGEETRANACGYVTYTPFQDPEYYGDERRNLECHFFLKLAWIVCNPHPMFLQKPATIPSGVDPAVGKWFSTMKKFAFRFKNERINFGYVIGTDSARNATRGGAIPIPRNLSWTSYIDYTL